VLSLFVWIRHRRFASGRSTAAAWFLVAAAALLLIGFAARAPRAERAETASTTGAIEWIAWDRAEAERLAASGRLVFLDIPADWCVTCKVNERLILNSPEVQAAFRDRQIVAMKADWTNRDDGIARFLAEHGRYGIPFYMLYRPGKPPHVFGELLTKEGVLQQLRDRG
jgi:thiol:disulfide interchange protein